MSNYDIDTAVEDTLEHMWQALNGRLNFLATHFSCGTPGVPGYIMQSAARAQQCPFADWAGADQSLHADVLIRHARQFQRSITVPALLAEHYDATGKSVVITLKVRDRSNVPLLIKKEDNTGYVCFHIQISKTLASVLCPRELPERYLKSLYEDARDKLHSDRRTEGDLRSFDLPRYEAFGMLIHRSKNPLLRKICG